MAKGSGRYSGPLVQGDRTGQEAPPTALSRNPTWATRPAAIPDLAGTLGPVGLCHKTCGCSGAEVARGWYSPLPAGARCGAWLGLGRNGKKSPVLPVPGGGERRVPRGSQLQPRCRCPGAFLAAPAGSAEVSQGPLPRCPVLPVLPVLLTLPGLWGLAMGSHPKILLTQTVPPCQTLPGGGRRLQRCSHHWALARAGVCACACTRPERTASVGANVLWGQTWPAAPAGCVGTVPAAQGLVLVMPLWSASSRGARGWGSPTPGVPQGSR